MTANRTSWVSRADFHLCAAFERHVSRTALDDAAVCRLRDGGRIKQAIPLSLKRGTTGLSVAFDLPTQLGHDSDAPVARGEVGKVGVAIDSVADMETLFDRIPLDEVTVSMTINSPASILLAMVLAVARTPRYPVRQARRHGAK